MPRFSAPLWPLFIASMLFLATLASSAQVPLSVPHSRIVQSVDDSRLTRLSGNTHPLARPEFDRGSLEDAVPLHRMVLVLKRSADQEIALKQFIDQQQDRSSPNYLQWLTPESFAAAFGPSDRDLSLLTAWLSSHGFAGIQLSAGRTFVEFNGNAGAVRAAFHTSIHRYNVNGQEHFANASDPEIPIALVPVIATVASLNNFPRRAANRRLGNFRRDPTTRATARLPESTSQQIQAAAALSQPSFTLGSGSNTLYGVSPYDFATIYNVLPLWSAITPIDGTGQTIAIVGETDINPADFVNFRKLFGLSLGNTATVTGTQFLNIIYNGPNPGVTSDEAEPNIDTQWSGAVAKAATIDHRLRCLEERSHAGHRPLRYVHRRSQSRADHEL
jgi:subtilase family serine protease